MDALIQALKDKRWSVRERAAVALGRISDARAVDPLVQVLKDVDRRVE
jgi:HEAT repeat protein